MAINNSLTAKRLLILLQIIMIVFSSEARLIQKRSSSLALFKELGFKLELPMHNGEVVGFEEVKRLVPSGPNRETSPESPDKFTPGVVGIGEVKRLVPSGPNPETSPESPDRFTPGVVGVGELKRLVPSGPNPETSPESPDRFAPGVVGVGEVKRLVPSGPNPKTSPESPPGPSNPDVTSLP